ncbi:hypothetical protein VTP01DRAFT_780 [Rhizomucor pusillus]|uniref:uncharacterized protein n=1 Tax=Rhizomucor pusillus TaxID=4840 RepID=UPI003742C35E
MEQMESDMAELRQKVQALEQTNQLQEQRIQALEAQLVERDPVQGNTDDARLLKFLRDYYNESLVNNPDTRWAVNETIDSSHNQVVMEALQEYIKNLSEREKNPAWTRSIVLDKLKDRLKYQKEKAKADEEVLQQQDEQKARNTRLYKKKAYEENQHLYEGVQGVEDILRPQYMSDEENIVVENRLGSQSSSAYVEKRATKLIEILHRANDPLDQLSELAEHRKARLSKRSRPERPRMVIEETEITMKAEELPRASATVRALSPSLRATLSFDYS